MPQPDLSFFYYIALDLKSLSDASTTTFNLSNRPLIGVTSTDYYPILQSLPNVGAVMGDYLPQALGGTIVLNNAPNSFGFERRFSDLLERFTVIDSQVKIYYADVTIGSTDPTASWELITTSRIARWRANPGNGTLELDLDTATIPKRIVTKSINSVDFPNAPTANLGRHIPLVLGSDIQVPAYRVAADGDTSPEYVYATSLGTDAAGTPYPVGGVQTYFAQNQDGRYQAVNSASAVSTAVKSNTSTTSEALLPLTGARYWYWLDYTSPTDNYVITQVEVKLNGESTADSFDGTITVEIWEGSVYALFVPTKLVASGNRPASDFNASLQGASDFWAGFTLDRPLVMANDAAGYWLLIKHQTDSGTHTINALISNAGGSSVYAFYLLDSDGTIAPLRSSASTDRLEYKLYATKQTDDTTPTAAQVQVDGLGHAQFEVTQKTALSGIDNPDLTKLNWIVEIDGLKDDSSGTVTGSANQLIESPQQVIELLDKEWNGTDFTGGRVDNTKFSATHSQLTTSSSFGYRKIGGATSGRTTLEDLYRQICRNSGLRIGLVNSATAGKTLGVYAWGTNLTATYCFTDDDCIIRRVESRGVETTVNRFQIFYQPQLIDLDVVSGTAEGQFKNYGGTIDWYPSRDVGTTNISDTSSDLYGFRTLETAAYDFVNDSTSADFIAKFLACYFALPSWFVECEVPFNKYKGIELFDVVEIEHPDLPAFFGTSSNAKMPTYNGADTDPGDGMYLKRANRYRAQIEAREIRFSPGEYPTLLLTARLLINSKDPT